MKGISTEAKLARLRSYINTPSNKPYAANMECTCEGEDRQVQVLNYLTALTRGGQLQIIPAELQFTHAVPHLLNDDVLVIRKQ